LRADVAEDVRRDEGGEDHDDDHDEDFDERESRGYSSSGVVEVPSMYLETTMPLHCTVFYRI
jgi:hypothetical protein